VCCVSLHPGVIKTELWRSMNNCFESCLFCLLGCFSLDKSISEGTSTQLFAAVSTNSLYMKGEYLDDCMTKKPDCELKDEIEKKLFD